MDNLKKPSAKFYRTWLPLIAVVCVLDLTPTSAYTAAFLFFHSCPSAIRAIAWHHRHGDTVAYDGHFFHLPASWYPDPESRPDGLMLAEAHFGSLGIDHVYLRTMPQKVDEHTAEQQVTERASQFNQHSPSSDRWILETLQGRRLAFHCMMSSTDGVAETLICQAADSDLQIFISTIGSRRAEALNILETSE